MKTVSLEIAKKLRESGYPQEGKNWWVHISHYLAPNTEIQLEHDLEIERMELQDHDITRLAYAPTADEILDILPTRIEDDKWGLQVHKVTNGYFVAYRNEQYDLPVWKNEFDDSLAEAAARLWLFLKEEGYLERL
jgi:hypothetical protein